MKKKMDAPMKNTLKEDEDEVEGKDGMRRGEDEAWGKWGSRKLGEAN